MPYRFLDDIATADIAFEATGPDLNELFASAADATLAVMLDDICGLEYREQRSFRLNSPDVQELLFQFLQEIIFYKDAECLLLKVTDIVVEQRSGEYQLSAELAGEPVDIDKHQLNVDIKAVTYHMFEMRKTADGYVVTLVLDI